MKAVVFGLLLSCLLFGQASSVITGVGYKVPGPIKAAPGQIITLYVHTVQTVLKEPESATGSPLPTTLAGLSVQLRQTFSTSVFNVPLLSVFPVTTCAAARSLICSYSTGITVQIPFELVPNAARVRLPENFATLTVSEKNTSGEALALSAVSDQIHIINSCDSSYDLAGGDCQLLVRSADGALVSSKKPLKAGDLLTVSAYGLGDPATPVATGVASPAPAISVPDVTAIFQFGSNPVAVQPMQGSQAVAASLIPGQIGIYGVTVSIPPVPAGTPVCGSGGVTTNLMVSIGRGSSFDSFGICVEP